MRFFLNRIVLALVMGAMAGSLALGKSKRDTIMFPENVKVNGTLVKSGTYEVTFDEKTNELAITKGGKVIAKAPGTLEKRTEKARRTEYRTSSGSEGKQLTSVAFSGSEQDILVANTAAKN